MAENHVDVHLGQAVSVAGLAMDGSRRHPADTDTTLVLTLYGQDGEINELVVPRTRSNELFQEWLRRYDRYTVKGDSSEQD